MTRFFIISLFVFIASFGVLSFATAEDGQDVVNTGTGASTQAGDNTGTAPVQVTNPAYGQPQVQSGSNVTLINPLKSGMSLSSFLDNILKFVIRIGTVVVILMIVYVGYLFVVAQGVPGKIEEARKALLWTVVGALILLGAQAIAKAIEATVKALGG